MADTPDGTEYSTGFRRSQVRKAYEQFERDPRRLGEIDVPALCEFMWTAGGLEMMRASLEFSDIMRSERRLIERIEQCLSVLAALLGDGEHAN